MPIDFRPLIVSLKEYRAREGHGAWAELSRMTEKSGRKISATTIYRTAEGHTKPTIETWEALFRADPAKIPLPRYFFDPYSTSTKTNNANQ